MTLWLVVVFFVFATATVLFGQPPAGKQQIDLSPGRNGVADQGGGENKAQGSLPVPVASDTSASAERGVDGWDFTVFSIDDHPVTVKSLLSALLILAIGIILVKSITHLLSKRLLPRTHFKVTAAAAIEKIFYYFSLLLVFLFVLRIVNVPLTAFAFLGGAIAIGVGFGAQNLINNFISGFIIMAERPIKIGDLVEVDGNFAVVEEIGGRCTRIRTGANYHILVPNSSFLEKNIINWTLSDKKIRTNVTVGVIYGSPVEEVRRLLMRSAEDNTRILKEPAPFVLFNDFGDSALVFDLYFWIRIERLMDRKRLESDVRFRIDDSFREAGIVIAFPQRDLHLDARDPIRIRVLGDSGRIT
ncbi:MAG: mechanosensitive ion channel [Deltaproteobacteria bacterium]|nr:mechanosensitive ion channel [Deltaproteobacteria bacterium]